MRVQVQIAVFVVDTLFLINDVFIQAGAHLDCGVRVHPVNGSLDLAAGEAAAALCLGIIGHMNCRNIAVLVLVEADAFDEIGVHQAHFVAGEETVIFFGRLLHKIILLDPELTAEGDLPLAQLRVLQVIVSLEHLHLAFGIVVNDQLKRMQDRQHALAARFEILPDAVFQSGEIR